jgi:hypothetical protein
MIFSRDDRVQEIQIKYWNFLARNALGRLLRINSASTNNFKVIGARDRVGGADIYISPILSREFPTIREYLISKGFSVGSGGLGELPMNADWLAFSLTFRRENLEKCVRVVILYALALADLVDTNIERQVQ